MTPLPASRLSREYCRGYELDRESSNLIPAGAIGRMLNRQEVRQLMRELEMRVMAKRPAAAASSVWTPRNADRAGTRKS